MTDQGLVPDRVRSGGGSVSSFVPEASPAEASITVANPNTVRRNQLAANTDAIATSTDRWREDEIAPGVAGSWRPLHDRRRGSGPLRALVLGVASIVINRPRSTGPTPR